MITITNAHKYSSHTRFFMTPGELISLRLKGRRRIRRCHLDTISWLLALNTPSSFTVSGLVLTCRCLITLYRFLSIYCSLFNISVDVQWTPPVLSYRRKQRKIYPVTKHRVAQDTTCPSRPLWWHLWKGENIKWHRHQTNQRRSCYWGYRWGDYWK